MCSEPFTRQLIEYLGRAHLLDKEIRVNRNEAPSARQTIKIWAGRAEFSPPMEKLMIQH